MNKQVGVAFIDYFVKKSLCSSNFYKYYCFSSFFFFCVRLDEDMPLNLSTKPSNNSYNSNNNSVNSTPTIINSRSNSIIWSPASMCEQEKTLDNIPTDLQQSIENLENRNNFIKHYNNFKSLALLQQSARNEFNYGKIDKGYFTHLQQKVKEQIISENNNNNNKYNNKRGENRANNDNNILNNNNNSRNNNKMFMLNNNNVIMVATADKEMTRPDSTAQHNKLSDETGRRKERNFQVSDTCIVFL